MNKDQKKVLQFFLAVYLISFFIVNWNDVSWIFNYRAVSGLLYDFFTPYQSIDASYTSDVYANYSSEYLQKNNNNQDNIQVEEKTYPYSAKNNILEIPAIRISVPVIIPQSASISLITKELDKGVVYYPGSVLPGKPGQIVILGHSAPPNWPKTKNDWVFSDLNDLQYGDQIILYFNHKEYTYNVRGKTILGQGEEVKPTLSADKNILTLVSCWPPGKNLQRITVEAEIAQ